jgi:hypothetical protein
MVAGSSPARGANKINMLLANSDEAHGSKISGVVTVSSRRRRPPHPKENLMAVAPHPPRRNIIVMTGNRFGGIRPGDPAFEIATNLCGRFELGMQEGTDYWLQGNIVGGTEFLFNGRLFLPDSPVAAGTIIDNFPKGATPQGWTTRPRVDGEGYELTSAAGVVIFGYRVEAHVCHVTVNIYAADGDIVAESIANEFRIYRRPINIGGSSM